MIASATRFPADQHLKDMNTLTPEDAPGIGFSSLYDAIETRLKEDHAKPAVETTQGARSGKQTAPKSDVTANNGSTAIGSIQVGGSVTGNIVIGNSNQVNSKM